MYVVNSSSGTPTAALHPVTVGLVEGNDASIDNGIQAGDTVVIDGADKLQDGSSVMVAQPAVQQSSATAPSPAGGSDARSHLHK